MGNSICGQAPSHVWKLLADQFNKRTELIYDPVIMKKLVEIELEYFDGCCTFYNEAKKIGSKISAQHLVKNIMDKQREFFALYFNYTGDENFNISGINEEDDKKEEEQEQDSYPEDLQMVKLECDICLLNNMYGRKQSNYAQSLINRAAEEMEKNRDTNLIEFIHDLYKNESNGLAERFRMETVAEVQPCEEALSTWVNWSIL